FEGSNEDTDTIIDGRYIFHGEFTASRPKRRRHVYQESVQDSEDDDSDKENTAPTVPVPIKQADDDGSTPSTVESSRPCTTPTQEPEEPLPRSGVVPNAERCTLCDHIPGPKTPHRAENCRWTT
ncbi:hypothetical protein EC968_010204, partial [Mortierella alpina]